MSISRPAASQAPPPRGPTAGPARALAAFAIALFAAASWRISQAAGHRLWLDELYTTTLIDTPGLAHVWDGALRGVDGNPPLYLSLAWLLTHRLPVAPEQALRLVNLVVLAAAALLLYRIARRFADPLSAATGLTLLCGVDGLVGYALLEVRTYALYLALVVATLWATLRLVDRPSRRRVVALAGIGVAATLAHSFGGFYVLATLGSAGIVAWTGRDGRRLRALAAGAALPALALGLWIKASLAAQLAVATPYGWIPVPDGLDLLDALGGSWPLTLLLLLGLACFVFGHRPSAGAFARWCRTRPDLATLGVALAGFAALTGAGWLGSQVITPFFVGRYFIPNAAAAGLALAAGLAALRQGAGRGLFALAVAICLLLGLAKLAVDPGTDPRAIPCSDASGNFLEAGLAGSNLPVIAESPHAWLPRARYAPDQVTLYPLDWQVVLRFPFRARNNAMDFHIMEILKGWAPPGAPLSVRLLTTEEILARHRHILVLDEAARSWFTRLKAIAPVSARLLRDGPGCRLWDVTLPETGAAPAGP